MKVIINVLDFPEVIIDIVVKHYSRSNSIIIDESLLFTSKLRFSLCYFLKTKQNLFIVFYSQTNS